jgi:hypothetical protein
VEALTLDLNIPKDARLFLKTLEKLGRVELEGDQGLRSLTDDEAVEMATLVFLKLYPVSNREASH